MREQEGCLGYVNTVLYNFQQISTSILPVFMTFNANEMVAIEA